MVDVNLEEQYEQFAPFYELIFSDWDAMVREQALAIDDIVQKNWSGEKTLLDLSCGVGTQSIGLAALGYQVTGIDLTRGMIRRATQEAESRHLPIRFLHGDMRDLHKLDLGQYRTIISCENSLPHLNGPAELAGVLRAAFAMLEPGGGAIFTLRDFARRKVPSSEVRPYGTLDHEGKRFVPFQVRDFGSGACTVSWYFVEHRGDGTAETTMLSWKEYPLTHSELADLMTAAGFEDVRVSNSMFEVVVHGRRPA